jgi:hypothetical protein
MSPLKEIATNDSAVKKFQKTIYNHLTMIFGENNLRYEWDVSKESRDGLNRNLYPDRELYCPRLDIAVGDFNIDGNVEYNDRKIKEAAELHKDLIHRLWENSESQVTPFDDFMCNRNNNPRCLLAIEIENSGSSKHMIGNIANVAIIGSMGIVIPFNHKKLLLCRRIKNYIQYVTRVKKIEKVFQNVLIVEKDKFLECINHQKIP